MASFEAVAPDLDIPNGSAGWKAELDVSERTGHSEALRWREAHLPRLCSRACISCATWRGHSEGDLVTKRLLGWAALLVLTVSAQAQAAAHGHGWPQLTGDTRNPVCRQAYRLAKAAFRSPAFQLQGPFAPSPDLGSTFSVYRAEADISGGDGLASDDKAFEAISLPENGGTLFWQRAPGGGARVAVLETHFNWQGDIYTTFVLPTSVSRDALIQGAVRDHPGREIGIEPLFGGFRWNPPLVLTDMTSGVAWIIDLGEPYEALPDWRVFAVSGGTARSPCSIAFRPKVKSTVSLSPAAVRGFAASLDEALGPDADEGTLHPTARIRIAVANGWANAHVRPWAVVTGGYNSHEEVEAGLKLWAAGSKARTGIYRPIRAQYGPAGRAMAADYAQRFGLSPRDARAAGRFVIAAMFREYFTFHREAGEPVKPEPTPWPAGKR